jgi:hypothetical protein
LAKEAQIGLQLQGLPFIAMIGQGQACGLSHGRTTEESRGEKSLEEERHEVESMYCHYFLPAFRTSFTVELIECWCFLVTSGFGKG